MGAIIDELVAAGFEGYRGWNDDNAALADFNATGGAGKEGGGGSSGSSGGTNLPPFSFDDAAAQKAAMEELRPYYEKLLSIYNGDIAMAKKRMEEDYARGLRYKSQDTATGLGDIAATRAERDRKFKLALGDLDQEMNARGLTSSGIKTTNVQNAKADEAFQQQQLTNQARDLTESQKRYEETSGVDRQRFLEDKGFAPVTDVNGFVSEPYKKYFDTTQEMIDKAKAMALAKRQQAQNDYQVGTTPIATATPTNWTDILNNSLKIAGLPTTG